MGGIDLSDTTTLRRDPLWQLACSDARGTTPGFRTWYGDSTGASAPRSGCASMPASPTTTRWKPWKIAASSIWAAGASPGAVSQARQGRSPLVTEPESIYGPGIGAASRQRDRELDERFDTAMAEVKANGAFERLQRKYFGE